jgi:hypothetical protein
VATSDVAPLRADPGGHFGGNSFAYWATSSGLQDGEWYGFGPYIRKLRPPG